MRQHHGRAQVVQISSPVARLFKWLHMPVFGFWVSVAVMILPVVPEQWEPPAVFSNFCPAVLAQDTAGETQPFSPATPQPPTEGQSATDTTAGSTTEAEQAPVEDPAGSSPAAPEPPAAEQSAADTPADSTTEAEQAPVADPDGSSPAVDSGNKKTLEPEPDAPAESKQMLPPDSQAPSAGEPGAKPFNELDSKVTQPGDKDDDVEPLPSRGDTRWDKYHEALSRRIINSAEWIDSFFDDERFESEANRTSIKLRFDTELKEGGLDFRLRVRVRLVLPRMENKLSLVISGDPDEDLQDGSASENIAGANDERNPTAAVWYSFFDTYKRNLSMRFGAQWRDSQPVLWLGPRYRQLWTLDPWAVRYTWSVRWFTDVGLESRMRLDFERPITKGLFFRQTTTYDWDQEEDVGFNLEDGTTDEKTVNNFNNVGFSVSIFQPLNRISILEYSAGVNFVNKPENVMNNAILLVKYRRQFWRDWLFFEVTPALEFPWIRDYQVVPSLLLRIEGIFGKYK